MVNQVLNPDKMHEQWVYYRGFMYRADSWNHVVYGRQNGAFEGQFTYIVTNMTLMPRNVIRFYFQCETWGISSRMPRTASLATRWAALIIKIRLKWNWPCQLTFNIKFCRLCLTSRWSQERMGTLHTKLVKIEDRLVFSGRSWTWKLCSSCIYRRAFVVTLWWPFRKNDKLLQWPRKDLSADVSKDD